MTYLNLSKTLNTQILDNLNSKTMETKNPILSLSLQELNTLKLAISKDFSVVEKENISRIDYRTRWFDIYHEFIKYIINNYEEIKYFDKGKVNFIAREIRITWANEKEMTYGRIADILIDKRIEHLKSIEANEKNLMLITKISG
jgi:hypothetical protein